MSLPAALLDAFESADLESLDLLVSALRTALLSATNRNIKQVRCKLVKVCRSPRERNAFMRFGSKISLEESKSFEERMAFLYLLNDLMHWSGGKCPEDLTASIQAVALAHLRAACYAPDVATRGSEVKDLLSLWRTNQFLEPMALSGLQAGLLVPPKVGQYSYESAATLRDTDARTVPMHLSLGRSDQAYSDLPASTMLPHLLTYEERIEANINSLTEVPHSQCRMMSVRVRPELLQVLDRFLAKNNDFFPEDEAEEPSKLSCEGWDDSFWQKRQSHTI